MELTLASIWPVLKVLAQKLMIAGPIMSQYFWYINKWIPLGPRALLVLKEKRDFLNPSGVEILSRKA